MAQINIAGTLHNTEEIQGDALNSHVVAHADEILDSTQEKKQSEVNADVDTALADRYTKEETYNKTELDNLITTPNVQYVTVATYSALPATGEGDTIYRVASWDGTAVDAGKYSEYAWNGSAYQLLAVRSGSIDGVFDISANNLTEGQPTQYADLAAALGTNGANVPVGVRAGGMQVRFINSSTGKYKQCRLMAASWSTTVTDWQDVDETPTAGSQNLVESGGVSDEIGALTSVNAKALGYTGRYNFYGNITSGVWKNLSQSYQHRIFNVSPGDQVHIKASSSVNGSYYTFLKTYKLPVLNDTPDFSNGYEVVQLGKDEEVTVSVPNDAKYLYILYLHNNSKSYCPKILTINGEDAYLETAIEKFNAINVSLIQTKDAIEDSDKRINVVEDTINGRYNKVVNGFRIISGKWKAGEGNSYLIIRVNEGDRVQSTKLNNYAWLTEDVSPTDNQSAPLVDGTSVVNNGNNSLDVTAPNGTKYLYVLVSYVSSGVVTQCRYDNLTINNEAYNKKGLVDVDTSTPILFEKVSSTSFNIHIYDTVAKKYLTHTFLKRYATHEYTWGDNESEEKVVYDCWVPNEIQDGETPIVQGNVNFIHRIANTSHYVGEGHGSAISVYTKFYMDGIEFNPSEVTSLSGRVFKMIEKVNYYYSESVDDHITYPEIDNNGNFILTAIHFAEATYSVNNKISVLNRLTIKRDNTVFAEIFAGMCRVYLPYFNRVYLNDPDNTANYFSHDGTNWTFTDIGGSGIMFDETQALKGSNVIVTGQSYYLSQTLRCMGRAFDELNYRLQVYNDNVKSIKVYQCPAIGTFVGDILGESAETFMDGDVLECWVDRQILCKMSS